MQHHTQTHPVAVEIHPPDGKNIEVIEQVLTGARDVFNASRDFTLGVEEEYALLNPETLDLESGFEQVKSGVADAGLEAEIAGELLAAEVEFRTMPCENFDHASRDVKSLRRRAVELISSKGLACATSGTHPWADYRTLEKVDLGYYHRMVDRMQWVIHRNNTFGLHVHVGVRGADRAIAVANALRNYQPALLAMSASSPFLDGGDTGLSSVRSVIFSRIFPRGFLAPAFQDFDAFTDYVRLLANAGSIETYTQIWWGIRPHLAHGTVELRMFDGQPDVLDTVALTALSVGLVADLCARYDAGEAMGALPAWWVEENSWRATRYGLHGNFIVPDASAGVPADADRSRQVIVPAVEAALEAIATARSAGKAADLGIDDALNHLEMKVSSGGSSTWQRQIASEKGLQNAYSEVVKLTMAGV